MEKQQVGEWEDIRGLIEADKTAAWRLREGQPLHIPTAAVSPVRPFRRRLVWSAALGLVVLVGGFFYLHEGARESRELFTLDQLPLFETMPSEAKSETLEANPLEPVLGRLLAREESGDTREEGILFKKPEKGDPHLTRDLIEKTIRENVLERFLIDVFTINQEVTT